VLVWVVIFIVVVVVGVLLVVVVVVVLGVAVVLFVDNVARAVHFVVDVHCATNHCRSGYRTASRVLHVR
jgi:hypothetical protein